MHQKAAILFGLLVAVAWFVSSAHAAGSRYVLRDTTYHLTSEFASDSLLVREFLFEDQVLAAEVDSSSGTLLLAFPRRESDRPAFVNVPAQNRIVAYDLNTRQVRWTYLNDGLPIAATAHRALLGQGKTTDLLRLEDGRKLAALRGQPVVWSDGISLGVTDDAVVDWNLAEASEIWKRERETGGIASDILREDSVAYLFAEGVQRFDLRDGSGWSFSMRANRRGLYRSLGGGVEQVRTMYGGARAVDMTAEPLLSGPDIFFAADTTVVRLDALSGTVRWQRPLRRARGFSLRERALGITGTQEFLGHLLVRDSFSEIAVASLGWASGAKNTWMHADPPSLALLAKNDGRLLARVQVPGVDFLLDERSTGHRHYLLGADQVLLMDDSLQLRAAFHARSDLQPLGAFLDLSGLIVITTGVGIAALSPDSLQLSWSQRCGRLLAIQRTLDWFGVRYFATTQGLLRLEHGTGRRATAYFPLRSSWAKFQYNGVMMAMGPTLRLVVMPESGGLRRID